MRAVRGTLVALGMTLAVVASVNAVGAPTAAAAAGSQSDGPRTLTVSQVDGLDAAGQVLQVSGSGYDTFKGIYVAFCVIPPTGQAPSPCGGGVDMSGASGASHWISDKPPSYGEGVAEPYGPGGSFTVTLAVSPTINGSIDCRRVRCAVVTRNDHIRSSDRSQDVFVPVTFAVDATGDVPAPTETPPEATAPPSTDAPQPEAVAPETTESSTTTTAAPTTTTATPADDDQLAAAHREDTSSSSSTPVLAGVGVALVAATIGAVFIVRRRRVSS